jgi:hypothetical protein
MRINVRQVSLKVLTALLRLTLAFVGIPLIFYFYTRVIPDLMKSESLWAPVAIFAAMILPMALDSMIDRDDKSNQTLTTNEKRNT